MSGRCRGLVASVPERRRALPAESPGRRQAVHWSSCRDLRAGSPVVISSRSSQSCQSTNSTRLFVSQRNHRDPHAPRVAPADSRRLPTPPTSRTSQPLLSGHPLARSPNNCDATETPGGQRPQRCRSRYRPRRAASTRARRGRALPRFAAPMAMRMPISRVRRDTLYDIKPNRPIAATNKAMPPKSVYACARTFSCANRRSSVDICVCTVTTGTRGSTAAIASRAALITPDGSPAVRTLKTRSSGLLWRCGMYIVAGGSSRRLL